LYGWHLGPIFFEVLGHYALEIFFDIFSKNCWIIGKNFIFAEKYELK